MDFWDKYWGKLGYDCGYTLLLFGAIFGTLGLVYGAVAIRNFIYSPWERQNQHVGPYTVVLASDGCYYRDYLAGGKIYRHVEIMPDSTENCPYRKK